MERIPLSQGLCAVVDSTDFAFISQWSWYAGKVKDDQYRAMRKETINGKTYTIYMHRVLMGAPDGVLVDHIDGNPLHNWRSNLRLCSYAQNGYNKRTAILSDRSSQYKGVSKHREKWRARVYVNGKNKHLGNYDSEELAAKAYDRAALYYFGAFARTNFPAEGAIQWNTNINLKNISDAYSPKVSGNRAEEAIS